VANVILFAGYRFDAATGLYQVRHRYHHPTLGRWINRDPKGYTDGSNLYEYVASRPMGATDPMGTDMMLLPPDPGPGTAGQSDGIGELSVWDGEDDEISVSDMELEDQADPSGPILEGIEAFDTEGLKLGILIEVQPEEPFDLDAMLAACNPAEFLRQEAEWRRDRELHRMKRAKAIMARLRDRIMEERFKEAINGGLRQYYPSTGYCNNCKGPCYCAPPKPKTSEERLGRHLKEYGLGCYGYPLDRGQTFLSARGGGGFRDGMEIIHFEHEWVVERSLLNMCEDVFFRMTIGASSHQSVEEFLMSSHPYSEASVIETEGIVTNTRLHARLDGTLAVASKLAEGCDEAFTGIKRLKVAIYRNRRTNARGFHVWKPDSKGSWTLMYEANAREILRDWYGGE
jgi:RHS repeat-associated protein